MAVMDPKASLPRGDPLILQQARSHAPFSPPAGAMAEAFESREQKELKPLRSPKERPPVADQVDSAQVLSPASPGPTALAAPPPLAPPPAAPPPPLTSFRGGVDNGTTIPPDTAGAVAPTTFFIR
jgi:hypothetical protein